MPIEYDPSDALQGVLPKGEYEAILTKVEDAVSKKKGNAMQILTWIIFRADGAQVKILDYIVAPAFIWKLKQIAAALGKGMEFDLGAFQVDNHLECTLAVALDIEEQPGYPPKNRISGYKAPVPTSAKRPDEMAVSSEESTDIPF